MPPEDGPAEWRPGCPDCAELREELAEARDVATHFRNELADLRAEMRAAVTSYEAKLREREVALREWIHDIADPMDVYGPRP